VEEWFRTLCLCLPTQQFPHLLDPTAVPILVPDALQRLELLIWQPKRILVRHGSGQVTGGHFHRYDAERPALPCTRSVS
jgi:hypothetical protein